MAVPRGEIPIYSIRLIFRGVLYLRRRLSQCFSRGWDDRGIYAGKRMSVALCHTGRRVALFVGYLSSL